jgi:Tol biopolymer transport system component
MSLNAGDRLGPYEVLGIVGAGGMGQVYRARDTRLDRIVAIKVLPPDNTDDRQARLRLKREAQTIASLNNPNICGLYDVGTDGGVDYLVMELVEGETLEARLSRGALPLADALRIASNIASALAAAHRAGVVHRDLKPANVILSRAGAKLLDFGIARLHERASDAQGSRTQTALTHPHAILGTAPYMAPEQINGAPADERTDVFAFGAMLHEMLTGRRAFSGDTDGAVISSVLRDEPPLLSDAVPSVPPALARLVRACLAKDPQERWHSAADLRQELQWIAGDGSAVQASGRSTRAFPSWAWWLGTTIAAMAGVVAGAAWRLTAPTPTATDTVTFEVHAPPATTLIAPTGPGVPQFALSPDGRGLLFVALGTDGRQMLYLRSLDNATPRLLAGTEGAILPFWSPDGRKVAFFAPGHLKRLDLDGKAPTIVCPAFGPYGGSWEGDTILFADVREGTGALWRVPASGGEPAPIRVPDTQGSPPVWPQVLPGGRTLLYAVTVERAEAATDVHIAGIAGEDDRILLRADAHAILMRPDTLLFSRGGELYAQRLDLDRLQLVGEPRRLGISPGVMSAIGFTILSAANGVLAHGPAPARAPQSTQLRTLTWWNRSGHRIGTLGEPALLDNPAISPDARKVAVSRADPQLGVDIWEYSVDKGTATRLTHDTVRENSPLWSPDGARLVFSASGLGVGRLDDMYERESAGGGARRLVEGPAIASDWTRDGRWIVSHRSQRRWEFDLYALDLHGDGKDHVLIKSPYTEAQGRISRDGRWLAYVSDETGRLEVHVRAFPPDGRKWMVSTAGGTNPMWRDDSRELFYLAPDDMMMSVPVIAGPEFDFSKPVPLFRIDVPPLVIPLRRRLDVTADGQRFLTATPLSTVAPTTITLTIAPTLSFDGSGRAVSGRQGR